MGNKVEKFSILSPGGNLFDIDGKYVIPFYQRAFAWKEKQLFQLIEDISDASDNADYYIGSLIVSRKDNQFEVVDGQQRLTSLYLLMSCLGIKLKHTLEFACRDKSNYTLQKICELVDENRSGVDLDRVDGGLHQGIRTLKEKISRDAIDRKVFQKKLQRVILYRIEVPEHTDLNRYFEIMNTRGEQLEQHDILKADLMSNLASDKEKDIFAKIWEACSDMTGYVQMHFDKESREWIFGNRWEDLPSFNWSDYTDLEGGEVYEGDGFCISDIVKEDFQVTAGNVGDEEDHRVRFESIIEFPYFLLHVLKVFVKIYSVTGEEAKNGLVNELLDDKKLLDSFLRIMKNGKIKGKTIVDHKSNFSKKFIICLLRSRFLFDKYVIKREYVNDNSDGVWSLKELQVSGQQSKKRPYYTNTRLTKTREREAANDNRTKTNIMIQSALRVSYTSPKVMHWITRLLVWLSKDGCKNTEEKSIMGYDKIAEGIARNAVLNDFFSARFDGDYAMGVRTPHIVFHYLDFLLWKADKKKYDDFNFEFRNSVEHWYPQNPSEDTFPRWDDGVDQFGNLCMVPRNVNAKFSNMSPEAKKSTFYRMIEKGSLKLRRMSELTQKNGNQSASLHWKEKKCSEHELEMIRILEQACGIE